MSLKNDISLAVELLKRGEVVAFPTETVYGLGARISDEKAIKKIYEIKGRAADNPLIVHVASLDEIYYLAAEIPPEFFLLQEFFPGPLTVILKRNPAVTGVVSAGLATIAIRMPSHPVAQKLLRALGEPIAAPSANLSGKPSPTTAEHVREDFEGKIPLIIDGGPCELGIESTVISLVHFSPTLLRPGSLSKEKLERALSRPIQLASSSEVHYSPGMKYRHYAPKAKIKLFEDEGDLNRYVEKMPSLKRMILSKNSSEASSLLSAKTLYAHFRRADQKEFEEICVLCDAEVQSDIALMNRLTIAAKSS